MKDTPYKWLDLSGLFHDLLPPDYHILKIKYFTARVQSRPNDQSKPQRQDVYLRAIKSYCHEVEIIFGRFQTTTKRAPLRNPGNGPKTTEILHIEEKGSDVNLAVHMLNDAWMNEFDSAVVVTNDSDISEAIRIVKPQLNKHVGLITPGSRHPSFHLNQYADFHRHIRENTLQRNQLPSPIPGTNVQKPHTW